MDLKEAIYTRRAVREYTAEAVDDKGRAEGKALLKVSTAYRPRGTRPRKFRARAVLI